jgi:hypothetical protein
LEREVAQLRALHEPCLSSGREWVDELSGKFAGDPVFARAAKLGRKYRQSLRPRGKKRSLKK